MRPWLGFTILTQIAPTTRHHPLSMASVAIPALCFASLAATLGIVAASRADQSGLPPGKSGDLPLSQKANEVHPALPTSTNGRLANVFEQAFPCNIGFSVYQTSWSGFDRGDQITIRAMRGNRPRIEYGGSYAVLGDYTLASMSNAYLGLRLTRRHHGLIKVLGPQDKQVDRGSGTFVLWYTLTIESAPHVSFYPNPRSESKGGVYFVPESLMRPLSSPDRVKATRPIFKYFLDATAHVEIGDPIFKNFLEQNPPK